MIRHHDDNMKVYLRSVIVQTGIQYKAASVFGKYPAMMGAESEKVGFVVALQMRKLAPVEASRHDSFEMQSSAAWIVWDVCDLKRDPIEGLVLVGFILGNG